MHSTTGQTSSTVSSSSTSTPSSSSTTTNNIEQYHYPPISTLRRPSRPSNIDLSVFDIDNNQQSNDPGIYSAPICHLKQTNNTNHHHHHHAHHIQQTSLILSPHPHTATFHYQPQQQQQQQQQHIQLSSHLRPQQQHNIHQYQQQTHHPQQQQQQQQQQQHLLDPFSQHQHTPHTFPLQTSSNHYHHYFHFPPATQNLGSTTNSTPPAYNQLTLQANVTSNGHHSPLNHRPNPVSSSTTNTSQPSTPTHNNRLLAVQIQEQQQQWSNPVLSPLMVKRINEGGNVVTSMHIDDDEDPSASIDALVADVDSSSHDLLDDQQNKSVDENKATSTTPLTESRASTTSPSAHLYLRSTSHILTTPPNPLASNDHPDNQLTVGNNFQKTFSPIHSAGFELTTNNSVQISSSSSSSKTTRTSFFTFDTNILEENNLKNHLNEENKEDNQDKMIKPLIINTDERTNTISTNSLSQDDNSNHSSTNSNSQNTSSRTLSQILQSSGEKTRLSSSSPLSTDIKLSPLHSTNTKSQSNISSLSPSQQGNRHYCTHPDCTKVFANKSALAKHKLTHCQDRKHKCLKCNKGFKRLDHLHGHMLTHEEEKPHKCRVPDCNRTYCDARSLKRHIENAHQNILAAIHEGGHEEYKTFLPETAFVKTKDLSSDFSIDSIDSNSPRSSSIDNEQSFHMNQQIRSSNGQKMIPTYTFDEEKCVECHICKKSFKNGAALNGHMRLHGGFNDKQSLPSVNDNNQKKKRITLPINSERRQIKRKRPNSPTTSTISSQRPILQRSMHIKNEEDIMMISSPLNTNHHHTYQQTIYPTLPPCSDVLQHRFYDRSLSSSRTRSISSSVVQPQTNPLTHYNIKNPLSVQPVTNLPKSNRKQIPLPSHFYDRNNNHYYGFDIRTNEDTIHNRINISNHTNNSLNIPTGILRFDHLTNPQMFTNLTTMQPHEEKIRKTLSADETLKYYHHDRQTNDLSPSKHSSNYPYFRSISNQHHPTNFSQLSVPSPPTSTITPNIFHHILRHTNDIFNKEFYLPRTEHHNQHHSTLDEPIRYTPSTSPYATHIYHSPSPRIVHSPADKIPNPTSSVINTPVTSPYSNLNTSRCSPASVDMCNNTSGMNSMQPSPLTNSTSSLAAPKKRILNALKQEAQDEQQQLNSITQDFSPIIEQTIDQDKQQTSNLDNSLEYPLSSSTLKIVPDVDSPIVDSTKTTIISGFLITTPSSSSSANNSSSSTSSTSTNNSSSSTSSNTHFNYENLPPIIPSKISNNNTTNSSFQWPLQVSQFRRPQNLHITSNPLPTTPYTPPPMLSPFRKGPGLYYQVFSQTTPAIQQTSTATTPVVPYTPIPDEILGPKINIGKDYQADIPKLQMKINEDDETDNDDLLFSPSQLPYLDENALEKYEQLSRTNPLLFSPRHSPTLYPIELVYMLLHEYNGDLQRTLAALLDGTAQDIKQCRPLHRYHFPECDTWTKEEIDAFTKAMETSEKNFLLVSRAVGTKTVKQCIEFHYMPKVNLTNRETGMNSLIAKRKRLQMIKNKQQAQKQIFNDDTSSSSSLNEFRLDDESDNNSTTIFSCDIDDCLQTFTSERAYRAHRNDHRRIKNNRTPPTNTKRNRNLDLNK